MCAEAVSSPVELPDVSRIRSFAMETLLSQVVASVPWEGLMRVAALSNGCESSGESELRTEEKGL